MSFRCIRVSARVAGRRQTVHVHIYATQTELAHASDLFNGEPGTYANTLGATHAWIDGDDRATQILVYLTDEHLTHVIASHELLHAAHALYGAVLDNDEDARAHLHHYNEELAHLHSDLYGALLHKLEGTRR